MRSKINFQFTSDWIKKAGTLVVDKSLKPVGFKLPKKYNVQKKEIYIDGKAFEIKTKKKEILSGNIYYAYMIQEIKTTK